MLAFLALTTPLLLTGLALLALPLIAHWLHRRSRRTIVFPSISLLLETVAQQSQFHRLKRWLLLALRLMAVACIVLAFTRPVWQSAAADAAVSAEAAAAVVVIVDVSASTGQIHGGVTELESLKSTAAEVLDDLQTGGDVAGIIVADGAPRTVFPRLSANLGGLRRELARLQPSAERADFAAAFAAAGKLLAGHEGPRRVQVLTDGQRSNWDESLAQNLLGQSLPAGTIVSLSATPRDRAANVALSRPRQFPSLPLAGEPFDVTVQVSNHSDATRQLRAVCERTAGDGSGTVLGRDEQTIALAPQEQRDVSFRADALESERQFVRIEAVVDDGLAIDDVAWLVVATSARTPVVVISDDDPEEPGSSAYYLLRALAPDREAFTRFEPQHVRSAQLTADSLANVPVVVVGYLGALPDAAAAVLTGFVRRGGGLVIFSGEGPVSRNLESLTAATGGEGLLPWTPGPRRSAATSADLHLGQGRWQSRWLRAFDEQSQLSLQQIEFGRVWTAGAISPAAEVLLQFSDGSPALGVRSVERGVLVLAAFSPESTASDLARHGAFVAFTQMVVQASIPEAAEQSQPLVGQSWTWRSGLTEAETAGQTAIGPDGQPVAKVQRQESDQRVFSIPRLSHPGLYQVRRGGVVAEATAVSVDPRESDLERLPASSLQQRLEATGLAVAPQSAVVDGVAPLRGRPLWGTFLSAALVAIGLELFLLGWWRR